MSNDLSAKWYVMMLGRISIVLGWSGFALLFVLSLWSVLGEYLFSALVLVYMLAALIDDIRKKGWEQMFIPGPLARNYFIFRITTLIISGLINLTVYLNLLTR